MHCIDDPLPHTELGSRYLPIAIEEGSESDSEDPDLAALIHERVMQVKKEIDWENEELKFREMKREKEELNYCPSSDESDSECAETRQCRTRRRRGAGSLTRSLVKREPYALNKPKYKMESLPLNCSEVSDEICSADEKALQTESEWYSVDEEAASLSDSATISAMETAKQLSLDQPNDLPLSKDDIARASTVVDRASESIKFRTDNGEVDNHQWPKPSDARSRDEDTPESTVSNCSASSLLFAVNLSQRKTGTADKNPPPAQALELNDTSETESRAQTPVVIKIKSETEPELENTGLESDFELESGTRPSPRRIDSGMDSDTPLSGYESGYVEDNDKTLVCNWPLSLTSKASPDVRQPRDEEASTKSPSPEEDRSGQPSPSNDNSHSAQTDSRRISTSTPVSVKAKSLQLVMAKTPPNERDCSCHMATSTCHEETFSDLAVTSEVNASPRSAFEDTPALVATFTASCADHTPTFNEPLSDDHMTGHALQDVPNKLLPADEVPDSLSPSASSTGTNDTPASMSCDYMYMYKTEHMIRDLPNVVPVLPADQVFDSFALAPVRVQKRRRSSDDHVTEPADKCVTGSVMSLQQMSHDVSCDLHLPPQPYPDFGQKCPDCCHDSAPQSHAHTTSSCHSHSEMSNSSCTAMQMVYGGHTHTTPTCPTHDPSYQSVIFPQAQSVHHTHNMFSISYPYDSLAIDGPGSSHTQCCSVYSKNTGHYTKLQEESHAHSMPHTCCPTHGIGQGENHAHPMLCCPSHSMIPAPSMSTSGLPGLKDGCSVSCPSHSCSTCPSETLSSTTEIHAHLMPPGPSHPTDPQYSYTAASCRSRSCTTSPSDTKYATTGSHAHLTPPGPSHPTDPRPCYSGVLPPAKRHCYSSD